MSGKDEYVAPDVTDVSGKEPAEGVLSKKETPVVTKQIQPSLEEEVLVIGVGRMTNAKGNETTDLIKNRIKRHFEYLSSKLRFKDDDERDEEQSSFIETIGNTLRLPFEQYVVVTDYLLQQIRESGGLFADGTAFRFTRVMKVKIPVEHVRNYRSYMTLLSMIANNWGRRHQLNKFIDIAYPIKDLPKAGKENVTQYFNKLMKV